MKNTYDPDIVMKIWEIFPDAFSVSKKSSITEHVAGRCGLEELVTGEETIILSECIANTASAISCCGTEMTRALKYIESYKPAWIQKREIKNFLR